MPLVQKIFGAEGGEKFFVHIHFQFCSVGTLFCTHSFPICTVGTLFCTHSFPILFRWNTFSHIQLANVPTVQIFLHKIFGWTSGTNFFPLPMPKYAFQISFKVTSLTLRLVISIRSRSLFQKSDLDQITITKNVITIMVSDRYLII